MTTFWVAIPESTLHEGIVGNRATLFAYFDIFALLTYVSYSKTENQSVFGHRAEDSIVTTPFKLPSRDFSILLYSEVCFRTITATHPALLLFMPPSPVDSASTSSLGLSSFHERHRILEEKHQWLLKQIKRKRTELKNFMEMMSSLGTEIFQKASPIAQKFYAVDAEIHELFEEILTQRKLGRKSRQDIINLYHSLQSIGLLSPKWDEEEERDSVVDNSSESDYFHSELEDDVPPHHHNADHAEANSSFANSTELESNSTSSRQMRETFLKLASLFHPDKVTETDKQIYHNEIMKEVNRAYEEGDIARLLEIERQHHLQENIDLNSSSKSEIERLCLQRERDNELLATQYENLKKELRIARKSPEGEMVKEYRAAKKQGLDAVAEMVSELKFQLQLIENIRNFVRDFRDKKLTIKEFLAGPVSTNTISEEEFLEMLLGKLLTVI